MGIGLAIGAAVFKVGGGILASKAKKRSARNTQAATTEVATKQFAIAKKGISLSRRQDEFFTRLRGIQLKQQASIAISRQRSAGQVARIGGVGGSFSRVQTAASESRAEVNRRLELNQIERAARDEQRALEEEQIALRRDATILGAQVQSSATRSSANVGLINTVANTVGGLATNPTINKAVGGFFGG